MNSQIESFIKSLKNIEVENYKSNTRKKLLQDFETQLSGNSECTESLVYILENRKDWQLKVASLCIICDHLLKTNLDIDLSMRTFTTLYKLTTELKEFNPSLSIGCLMRLLRRQDELKYSKIQEKVDDEIKKAKDAKMKEDDEKAKRSEEELYQLYGYGKENAAKTTNKKGKQANQKSKKKETGQKAKSPMDGERSYSEASTIDPGQGEDADGREREEDDVNVTSNDKQSPESPAKEGTDNADVRGQITKKGVNVTKTDTNKKEDEGTDNADEHGQKTKKGVNEGTNKKNTPTEEQGNSESGPTNEEFRNTGQNEDENGQDEDEETANQKEDEGTDNADEHGQKTEKGVNEGTNKKIPDPATLQQGTSGSASASQNQGKSESSMTFEEQFKRLNERMDHLEQESNEKSIKIDYLEAYCKITDDELEQVKTDLKQKGDELKQVKKRIAHLEWISSPLQLRRLVSYLIDPEKSTELDMKNCGGREMLGCLHVFLSKREIHKDEIAVTDKEMRLRFSSDQFKNNNDPDFPQITHFPGIIEKVCQHFGVSVDFL